MKRSPLARRTPLKAGGGVLRRTRLAPVSERRRGQWDQRAEVVAAVHRRDVSCRARYLVPSVACGGPLDVHEVKPRSADSTAWLNAAACKLLCRRHHEWVGDHPAEAHGLGLHAFSWEAPADLPPRRQDGLLMGVTTTTICERCADDDHEACTKGPSTRERSTGQHILTGCCCPDPDGS